MNDEEKYIQQRRQKAYYLAKRFHFMNTLPIQNNKIVFSAFEGDGGFCCNPRYIAEALHKTGRYYEMIWGVGNIQSNSRFLMYWLSSADDDGNNLVCVVDGKENDLRIQTN